MKKQLLWQLFNSLYISFILHLRPVILKEIKQQKIQEFNRDKYWSKFLAHIKKHLGHTDTSTNVENNCLKLSGFSADLTKPFLHGK